MFNLILLCFILLFEKKKISFHSSVPEEVGKSFEYLLPLLFSAFIFFLVKCCFIFMRIENPAMFINNVLQSPITKLGSTLPTILIINCGITFLWFFGFNGSYIFNSIMNPVYFSLNMENLNSIIEGKEPPHIITGTFQSLFINFGGSGSTIALIIALLLFSKNSQKKSLGKLALIPGIFNINEPIIYGLPVILNFEILFPFIFCPIINTLISYFTMSIGIVEKTNGILIPWTTPPIISGFLSSGISGAVLQVLLIILNILIYFPFVRQEKKTVD